MPLLCHARRQSPVPDLVIEVAKPLIMLVLDSLPAAAAMLNYVTLQVESLATGFISFPVTVDVSVSIGAVGSLKDDYARARLRHWHAFKPLMVVWLVMAPSLLLTPLVP
jgi:hypothetical protein